MVDVDVVGRGGEEVVGQVQKRQAGEGRQNVQNLGKSTNENKYYKEITLYKICK